MRYYELTFIGKHPLEFEQKINELIAKEGGILFDITRRAQFIVFSFQMEPENLISFEKKLRSDDQIPRFVLLTKKSIKSEVEPKVRTEKPRQKVELAEIEKKLEEILGT
jgi:RNase adaptor protein for sRNA GlmZ degradation